MTVQPAVASESDTTMAWKRWRTIALLQAKRQATHATSARACALRACARRGPMETITPNELHARAQHARIIDVREPREYTADLGHISGSQLVPLGELEAAAPR